MRRNSAWFKEYDKNMKQEHLNLTKDKLKEAKTLVKLFGMDFDGTVFDNIDFKLFEVASLVKRILDDGKSVAFVTARAASALKILVPILQELLTQKEFSGSCFIAGGNGAVLYEVKKDELIEIYNHGLEVSQIIHIVEEGKNIYKKLGINSTDLTERGVDTFKRFITEDWRTYISSDIVDVCRLSEGKFFTEQANVHFVLPKDKSLHQKIVNQLNEKLGEEYRAVAGDEVYVHVTKRLGEDSKAVAIKTILNILGLEYIHVATFGDMPMGNDSGLLSFPFSFTNSREFAYIKKESQQPPYILYELDLTPVAQVYKAIDFLLSE
jgi:hydroxymethylpyrimidine pyrophosphatase-like HAD family hydrolase